MLVRAARQSEKSPAPDRRSLTGRPTCTAVSSPWSRRRGYVSMTRASTPRPRLFRGTHIGVRLGRGILAIVTALLAAPTTGVAQNAPVTFAVSGDYPYGENELADLQLHVDQLNLYSPAKFFVHVGDIKS